MAAFTAKQLEDALGKLWTLVEDRLTDEDRKKLGIDVDSDVSYVGDIFEELHSCGPGGPCGIGLGRYGGHAIG